MGQQAMVTKMEVKGAKRTKVPFVEKLVTMQEGTPLDSLQMGQHITRLKRLPSISHAYYKVFSLEEEKYEVHYTIEENFTLIPFANLFSSANDDFAFCLGFKSLIFWEVI
ncbi:MAG: outer membrane protein assembly factor BamA [Maribacter sp.]|jgi:outer membrane protein assembly factor BamA